MGYKFNALGAPFDLSGDSASASTATNALIPQLVADPASVTSGMAWVLKSGGGAITGGGELKGIMGLSFAVVSTGSGSGGGALMYRFSYQTNEGTTVRVQLS